MTDSSFTYNMANTSYKDKLIAYDIYESDKLITYDIYESHMTYTSHI